MYTYTYCAGDGATASWACDDLPTVIRRAVKDLQEGLHRPMFVRGADIFLDVFALRTVVGNVVTQGLNVATGYDIVQWCQAAAK